MTKELKLRVRKFWELNPTFVEVTGGKMVAGGPFLNRVKGIQSSKMRLTDFNSFILLQETHSSLNEKKKEKEKRKYEFNGPIFSHTAK